MRHIPNILSFLRILLIGVFAYLFVNHFYVAALYVYVFSFLTDVFDGFLARRFQWISNLGKLLDPFADKLTLVTVLACLYAHGFVRWYIFAIALVKELAMILGGMFMLRKKNVVVYSDWWGKLATGLFFITISLAMIKCAELLPFIPVWFVDVLFGLAICMSVVSMFHYAYRGGLVGKKYKKHTIYEKTKPE